MFGATGRKLISMTPTSSCARALRVEFFAVVPSIPGNINLMAMCQAAKMPPSTGFTVGRRVTTGAIPCASGEHLYVLAEPGVLQ
jgi:hypothetical protein